MPQKIKLMTFAVIAAGAVGTLWLAGTLAALFSCVPFGIFGGAALLGKRTACTICTLVALSIAVAYGFESFYEAFRVHLHGEADGIAILTVPVVQSVLAIIALLIALVDWLICRRRYAPSIA